MIIYRSILIIIGVMLLLMGLIYGNIGGVYLISASIFVLFYSFNGLKWLVKKINIELNLPSKIFLIGSLTFIYLSFFEQNITIYNIIMSICCTILSWLFIIYLNIPQDTLNIKTNLEQKQRKYLDYKIPPKTLLNNINKTYEKTDVYKKEIDNFFKEFKLKIKYIDEIQNSWLITYKYEITTGLKIDDILGLKQDLEIRIKAPVEINFSTTESNIIYIKVPRKETSAYGLINTIKISPKNIMIPLGEDDSGNQINIKLEEASPIILLGETGTGKTNLLNIIINSILLNYNPHELKLILIDKHQTGLDIYERLPHLVLPLLNDPAKVVDYLDSINQEIDRRILKKDNNPPILVIIDELFDIPVSEKELIEKLEKPILLGKEVGIYLIITTSTMNQTTLMNYLEIKIKNKIYFYGRNITKYNPYKTQITTLKGIINYKVDNTEIRIRIPKITTDEILIITRNVKGLE